MHKTKTLKILIISLLLALPQLTLANGIISSTIKNPDPYSGNQSWFRYYESPGNEVKDALILRNLGNQPITIKLYATDAKANQAGSFSLKMDGEEQKGIGLWIELSKSEITLLPDQSEEVPFQINIPKNLSPGQYFGGIVHEEITSAPCGPYQDVSGACQGSIQIKTRSGNRVYLTIPGEVKQEIKLTNFSWKQAGKVIHFNFTFVNNGNVAFEPKAVISLYNIFNEKVATFEKPLGKSLPGSTISPIADWEYQNNFGPLTAKAQIHYNQDDFGQLDSLHGTVLSENKDFSIFVFPWKISLILILIIGVLLAIYFLRKKYYRFILHNCVDYEIQTDDNIIDIAERNNLRWQTIACINHLKAPYILEPGKTIKVPIKKPSKKIS